MGRPSRSLGVVRSGGGVGGRRGERRYTGALGTDFIIEEGAPQPQQTLGLREIDTRLAIASLSHKGRASIVTAGRLGPSRRLIIARSTTLL